MPNLHKFNMAAIWPISAYNFSCTTGRELIPVSLPMYSGSRIPVTRELKSFRYNFTPHLHKFKIVAVLILFFRILWGQGHCIYQNIQ